MKLRHLFCGLALANLFAVSPAHALNIWSSGGEMRLSGAATSADEETLKARLTPEIKTIVVSGYIKGSWEAGRRLSKVVENAGVTTVVEGSCVGFVCPMLFLTGKERMFSGSYHLAAHRIMLDFGDFSLPSGGEDSLRPWSEITSWWRDHTKLGRRDFWPRNYSTVRYSGPLPAETLVYLHPSVKTSKGHSWECFSLKPEERTCKANSKDNDALSAGIVTTLALYATPVFKAPSDVKPPSATEFAALHDTNLKTDNLSPACVKAYQDFLGLDLPRAFAVSSTGQCAYSDAAYAMPYRGALEACKKKLTEAGECRFYAVDEQVVFSPFAAPSAAAPK